MFIKFYSFILEEGDPEATCYDCGVVLELGQEVIAEVECDGCGYDGYLVNKRPEDFSRIRRYFDTECFGEYFQQCHDCGRYIPSDDVTWISGIDARVCDRCRDENYYCCDHCGEYFVRANVFMDGNGNVVCEDCYDRYDYHRCNDCGRICDSDEGGWVGDYYYCDGCIDDHSSGVHDYGYKPSPIFHRIGYGGWKHTTPDGEEPLYMGVELEVDDGNDTGCIANSWDEDDIYCKEDGSLSSDGFEIVSHPRTLESHKDFDWKGIMSTCLQNGFTSHDAGTCGLHVHVNRAFFGEYRDVSDFAAARIIILVSRFWDSLMIPFSRRTEHQLGRWAHKPFDEEVIVAGDNDDEIADKISRAGSDRYRAINIRNSQTIEFRLFRGTLKYSTFIATLELVDGICHWVKNHSLEETLNVSLHDFLDSEEFSEFDTMREYLERREIQIRNDEEDYDEEE